jgi:hypothetical protein
VGKSTLLHRALSVGKKARRFQRNFLIASFKLSLDRLVSLVEAGPAKQAPSR